MKRWLVLFLLFPALVGAQSLEETFRQAPARLPGADLPLGGMPLWHTNALLTHEQIQEFFDKGEQNGFAGYTFLPLSKTTPKYLSDEYFQRFGEVLDTAAKKNMKIVFYDDVDFPSGSAGGQLREKFPDSTLKRLDKYEWDVTGPAEFSQKSPVELSEKALFGQPAGVLQAAVAMNTQTLECVEMTASVKDGEVRWSVPEGTWKVMLFVCVADKRGLVDFMNPDAVRKLITLTYDRFYEKFPKHFGTTIPLCFYDDITNTQTEGSRNWTLGFNKKYEEMFGEPLGKNYPALFYNIGEKTPNVRWRAWSVRNELFADGYPKVVHEWCRVHGIKSSGHPQGPYVIAPIDMCGDAMLMHRASDATLFDSIHYYGHGRDGFKIPTSAAFQFDQPICVVEIYGNYRNNQFDEKMLYRSAMEIFARGGNLLLPHGIWSDPATMYIPPDISWRNPALNGGLPEFGKYVNRCSLLLQGGRHVADIGMVYPIDNLKAYFHFLKDWVKGDYPYGIYMPPETDYLAVGSDLTSRIYRDFTILHPDVIAQKCGVTRRNGQTFFQMENAVNWEEYEVLILPGMDVIQWKTLQKIAAFYDQGGKLLATTRLPSHSAEGTFDREVCETIQRIFGIDPRTQKRVKALKTGQEDIFRSDSTDAIRNVNALAQFVPTVEKQVEFTEPVMRTRAIFLPRPTTELLRNAVQTLVAVPDVDMVSANGQPLPMLNVVPRWEYPIQGMVQYIHKVKDGHDVYFLGNSSDTDITVDVRLRGTFSTVALWNPRTGEQTPMKTTVENGVTVVHELKIAAVESLFLVGKR